MYKVIVSYVSSAYTQLKIIKVVSIFMVKSHVNK